MVCIYCGGETSVINSRHQKRQNQVWRRRCCLKCRAVFTTEESVQYALSWSVWGPSGTFKPFSRDKLFLSLYGCLRHREDPAKDAAGLTGNVISKLSITAADAAIDRANIRNTAQVALNRFDSVASAQYQALHKWSTVKDI